MKECVICGEPFKPYHSNHKVCSPQCRKELERRNSRRRYRENIEVERVRKRGYKRPKTLDRGKMSDERMKRFDEIISSFFEDIE